MIGLALKARPSANLRGYWQRSTNQAILRPILERIVKFFLRIVVTDDMPKIQAPPLRPSKMPENDFVKAAMEEKRRLFISLQNSNADFRKYVALRKLIAAYGRGVEADDDQEVSVGAALTSVSKAAVQMSRQGSKAARVQEAVAGWFEKVQKRAKSGEIMQALKAEGIEFAGPKPTTALASILSHSDLFDNVRGEGYGLRVWGQNATLNLLDQTLDSAAKSTPETQAAAPESGTAAS